MYQPPHFREDRLPQQHGLIRARPFGLLVSAGPGGLMASPVPFLLDPEASERGTLRAHLARANPQWRDLEAAGECLAVFQGPDDYVSPSWYATKRDHGKVVPTWNYATVHCWGAARVTEDADWLRRQVEALTVLRESGRQEPWAVEDAPAPFIAAQIRGIVGIEIPIARIEGKWKVSQNRSDADRAGVAAGLRLEAGGGEGSGEGMARLVEQGGAGAVPPAR